jgi:hypothetical protein
MEPLAAHVPPPPLSRRLGLAVFCSFFFLFLLSTSREPPREEGRAIAVVAASLLSGSLAVPERWPETAPAGRKGRLYSVAPILPSLMHLPGAAIHRLASPRWPEASAGIQALTGHVGPALVGALTCWLFFHLLLSLGLSLGGASLGVLGLGLGTTVWIYARSPLSEVLQTACFTGLFAELLRAPARPSRGTGARLGAWAALLINTKLAFALALPGAALFVLMQLRWERRRAVALAWGAALPLLAGVILALGYNYLRWGALVAVPYALGAPAVFTESPLAGLLGMFLSPGKGLFVFCPLLALSIIGLPRFARRMPGVVVAFLATAGPVILLHAPMTFWSGDPAWGPRHLVFAVPALLLPAAALLEELVAGRRLAWLAAVALLAWVSVAVQLVGIAVYPDQYTHVAQEAHARWLGVPNRQGATPWRQGRACDPCFEDVHPIVWLPPFNPIEGQLWLAGHLRHGDDWAVAEADAPWHRYTKLKLDVRASYGAARIDWWYLEFFPRFPGAALALMLPMLLGLGGSLALWGRSLLSLRRRRT